MAVLRVTLNNNYEAYVEYELGYATGGARRVTISSVKFESNGHALNGATVRVRVTPYADGSEHTYTREFSFTKSGEQSVSSNVDIPRGTSAQTWYLFVNLFVVYGGAGLQASNYSAIQVPSFPSISPGVAITRCSDSAGTVEDTFGSYLRVVVSKVDFQGISSGNHLIASVGSDTASVDIETSVANNTKFILPITAAPDTFVTLSVTAIDNYGSSSSLVVRFATDYSKPVIEAITSLSRTDTSGNLDDEGQCAVIGVRWNVYYGGSQSGPSQLRVTVNGVTLTETSFTGTVSGNRIIGTSMLNYTANDLDQGTAYPVTIYLEDLVYTGTGAVSISTEISTAFFTMDVLAGGHGVSFGGPASQTGFWVRMRSFFENLLRLVKPSSGASTNAIEVNDGTNDTFTLDWDGVIDAGIKPSASHLPHETSANTSTFPIVLNDTFSNGGQFAYMNQSEFAAWIPIQSTGNFATRVYDATTSRTANTVLAAPNGSAGAATFRNLVAADIPALDTSKLTTGTLPVGLGGTGQTSLNATVAQTLDAAGIIDLGDMAMTATKTGLSLNLGRFRWLILRYTDGTRWYTKWVFTNKATSVRTSIERSIGSGTTAYYIASMDITIANASITVNGRTQMTCNSSGNSIANNAGLTLRNVFGVY